MGGIETIKMWVAAYCFTNITSKYAIVHQMLRGHFVCVCVDWTNAISKDSRNAIYLHPFLC